MKSIRLSCMLLLGWLSTATAALVSYEWTTDFANGGMIPDANFNGWQDTRAITDFQPGSQILDLNVTLNLASGFNGDLFGTLVHDSGFVVLLNRVGRTAGSPAGYANPGMNVTLDQDATGDIHLHGTLTGVLTGTWQPDGRATLPGGVLDTDPRTTSLNGFNGLDPNGSWTLFLQDVSFGSQSEVLGWGLEINAVPEPVTVALGVFSFLGVTGAIGRRLVRGLQSPPAGGDTAPLHPLEREQQFLEQVRQL